MPRILLVVSVSLLLAACETRLSFTAGAVESLPQVAEPANGLTSGVSITSELQLKNLFKQECFMPGDANYCPAGVDTSRGESSPFKFSSTTLLGLIFHAELYGGGIRSACTGRQVALTPANLKTTTGGDGMRFLVDTLPLYTCAEVADEKVKPRHRAYSVAPDYQATMTLDDHYPEGASGPTRTALWQVYTGLDSRQAPTVLAFNYAAVAGYPMRTVLLVNLVTHRFAIKYLTPPPAGEVKYRYVVALGVGGVDRQSGAGRPGYYFARYSDEETQTSPEETACVDNATQLIEVDDTECRNAGIPVAWTRADDVAAWLELSSAEQVRLAPFLAKFFDSLTLATTDTPTSADDADAHLPVRIE